MYHPSRGGVRGGTDQFSWETVKTDKHRENYLGHSVMAPVGRWQKGKDLSWYTKERKGEEGAKSSKSEEMAAIKRAEEEAMLVALGLKAPKKTEQTIGQEEITEVLKRDQSERGDKNIERIKGVGTESGRVAMFVGGGRQRKDSKGVAFETCSNGKSSNNHNIENKEATSKSEKKMSPTNDSVNSGKEKKHKKKKKKSKKKKHKKHFSDSETDAKDANVTGTSKLKHISHESKPSDTRSLEQLRYMKSKRCRNDSSSENDSDSSRSRKRNKTKHESYCELVNVPKTNYKYLSSTSRQRTYRHDSMSDNSSHDSDSASDRRTKNKKEIRRHKDHSVELREKRRHVSGTEDSQSDSSPERKHEGRKHNSKRNYKDKYRT